MCGIFDKAFSCSLLSIEFIRFGKGVEVGCRGLPCVGFSLWTLRNTTESLGDYT